LVLYQYIVIEHREFLNGSVITSLYCTRLIY
jgi:hypothetical protein